MYRYRYIHGAYIDGSTIRTRKNSSWCQDIHRSSDPKIQKAKNPKLFTSTEYLAQNWKLVFWILGFLDFWIFGVLDFWIFKFLDFWIFGISGSVALWFCGYLGTKTCISACRRGGEHMYIYIHIYIQILRYRVYTYNIVYIYISIHIYICISVVHILRKKYVYMYIYIYMYSFGL